MQRKPTLPDWGKNVNVRALTLEQFATFYGSSPNSAVKTLAKGFKKAQIAANQMGDYVTASIYPTLGEEGLGEKIVAEAEARNARAIEKAGAEDLSDMMTAQIDQAEEFLEQLKAPAARKPLDKGYGWFLPNLVLKLSAKDPRNGHLAQMPASGLCVGIASNYLGLTMINLQASAANETEIANDALEVRGEIRDIFDRLYNREKKKKQSALRTVNMREMEYVRAFMDDVNTQIEVIHELDELNQKCEAGTFKLGDKAAVRRLFDEALELTTKARKTSQSFLGEHFYPVHVVTSAIATAVAAKTDLIAGIDLTETFKYSAERTRIINAANDDVAIKAMELDGKQADAEQIKQAARISIAVQTYLHQAGYKTTTRGPNTSSRLEGLAMSAFGMSARMAVYNKPRELGPTDFYITSTNENALMDEITADELLELAQS